MKILVRNADNMVIYAGDDLTLDYEGAQGKDWRDPSFTQENATLVDAVLPRYWSGGVYSYLAGEWTVVDPAAIAEVLTAVKLAKWEDIKAHREYLSENGGYKVSVGGVDKWFHSDAKSKTQQLSLVLLGANVSAVPPWKTMDGSKVTMSQTLAGQIFAAAVTQDGTLFAAAESHRAAMQAIATPEAYDFSGGWPAVFGDRLC